MRAKTLLATVALALAASARDTAAQSPTGVPVPELSAFDSAMADFMKENGIDVGVLGVMKDGVIVYQRGFGDWENTPMRLASVEKPLTAAAIRVLVSWGWLRLDDKAFALNGNGGILPYIPWPQLKDPRLEDVEIQHLIAHTGGWDRDIAGDPMFQSVQIANTMGVPAPANRVLTLQYMLGQPLQYAPGSTRAYSNFGYMVLGMIVEQVGGMTHQDFIRNFVLTPSMWVPGTELFKGSTLAGTQHFREPHYEGPSGCTNVYNVGGPTVECAYGSFPLENFVGHGNLVGSAAPLLEFLDRFVVWGPTSGTSHGGSPPTLAHTGGLPGTSTVAKQRNDNIHVVVLFNEAHPDPDVSYALDAADEIYDLIDAGVTWPTESVDGFWIDLGSGSTAIGSYDNSFESITNALQWVADGTKLRFKQAGSTPWTGTLSTRLLIDSPFGTTVIGD